MSHYSDRNHPEYDDKEARWDFALDHYSGEYSDFDNNQEYLHRKEQRESKKAYKNRRQDSDPVLLFPTAVDSLNGIVSANEADVKREWGELGDPEEPDSIAYSLLRNADGDGMNWEPLMKQVGIKQTILHKVWGLVEGVQKDSEGNTVKEPHIKLLNPQSVVNWYPSTGTPEEVLVKEERDNRTGVRDTTHKADGDIFTLYALEGWTRFKVTENDSGEKSEEVIGQGSYEYWSDTDRTKRILPIFPCEIPMPRDVGYLLAQKQNHIYNKKSSRDWGVQIMSYALLKLVGDAEQVKAITDNLSKGANYITQDPEASQSHDYISPPSDYLSEAGDILEADKKGFYEAAFKQYGEAAKQVTATEIKLESRSGIEAFLSLLVTSIDEFENGCLWRLMQVYFPETPSAWGTAKVERSKEFAPEDIKEVLEQMSGAILNLDRAGAISTYRKVERANPDMTEDEIEQEVQRIREESGAQPIPDNQLGG